MEHIFFYPPKNFAAFPLGWDSKHADQMYTSTLFWTNSYPNLWTQLSIQHLTAIIQQLVRTIMSLLSGQ